MIKRYKKYLTLVLLVMALTLTGCGKEEQESEEATNSISVLGNTDTNTVKFSPNGVVLEISCEDYKSEGYDFSGLENYISSEIEAYNDQNGANKISLIEYDDTDGFVRVAIQYNDLDSYLTFNNLDIELSGYDYDTVVDIAAEDKPTSTDAAANVDTSDINLDELAEAGYDIDDLDDVLGTDGSDASATDALATFTDATTNNVVAVDDINASGYQMLISKDDVNYVFNSGKVLYFNSHCELINENTVHAKGDGKAVIVYSFEE